MGPIAYAFTSREVPALPSDMITFTMLDDPCWTKMLSSTRIDRIIWLHSSRVIMHFITYALQIGRVDTINSFR